MKKNTLNKSPKIVQAPAGRARRNRRKMLEFVKRSIADGAGAADTPRFKNWLILQLKYFCENTGMGNEEATDALEELSREGEFYLFALGEDYDNVVIYLPRPRKKAVKKGKKVV